MSTEESTSGHSHADRQASYLAEASGDLVAMSFPGARRIAGWLFWLVFPLLSLAAVAVSVQNIASHIGDRPSGIRGTFTVAARHCSQGFCTFGGTFGSADGSKKDVLALGDPRWHPGEVHQVVFNPANLEVVDYPGHWDPTPSVLAAIGGLAYLTVAGYFLRAGHRERQDDADERSPNAAAST